jgi:hypothetical protein
MGKKGVRDLAVLYHFDSALQHVLNYMPPPLSPSFMGLELLKRRHNYPGAMKPSYVGEKRRRC